MSDPKGYEDIHDLLVRADAPEMHFDLDGVVRQGKRVRSRRRAVVVAGALAAVGVAVVAFAGLGTSIEKDALPAGPSTSVSRPTTEASAELLNGRFTIKVVTEMDSQVARVTQLSGGQARQVIERELHPDRIALDIASAEEGLMIGVAPARAVSTNFTTSGQFGGFSTTQVPMPGSEYQALVLDFEKPLDPLEMPLGLWVDAQGQVHDVDGSAAPSITVPGTKDHVFFTRRGRQIGVVQPDGWYVKDFPSDWLANIQTQYQENGAWRTRAVVRVPLNSPQAAEMTWDGATSQQEVSILPLGDSPWAMVVSTVDGRAKLTSFTYVDEAGEPHTSEVR